MQATETLHVTLAAVSMTSTLDPVDSVQEVKTAEVRFKPRRKDEGGGSGERAWAPKDTAVNACVQAKVTAVRRSDEQNDKKERGSALCQ